MARSFEKRPNCELRQTTCSPMSRSISASGNPRSLELGDLVSTFNEELRNGERILLTHADPFDRLGEGDDHGAVFDGDRKRQGAFVIITQLSARIFHMASSLSVDGARGSRARCKG